MATQGKFFTVRFLNHGYSRECATLDEARALALALRDSDMPAQVRAWMRVTEAKGTGADGADAAADDVIEDLDVYGKITLAKGDLHAARDAATARVFLRTICEAIECWTPVVAKAIGVAF